MTRRTMSVCALALALIAAAFAPTAASAWAPADQATIHPGVQTVTSGGQCTANFIYQSGSEVYIGQAAHCSGTGAATDTNGCDAGTLPLGTPVEIDGASRPGTIAYSSWNTMQARGETDTNTCEYNDLALVRIDPADVGSVNPSVPGFGGPTGLTGNPGSLGSTVYSYGNSSLRFGVTQLSPKQGVLVQNTGGGWSHTVYTLTPGIPGDSGSGFFTGSGAAFGTLSTVAIAPLAGSNGVGNLQRELAYANANGGIGTFSLVPGTEPFNADLASATLNG